MQRQRGELVPIGDALSSMGGPVKAIRDASPQAVQHCFTVARSGGPACRGQRSGPRPGLYGANDGAV